MRNIQYYDSEFELAFDIPSGAYLEKCVCETGDTCYWLLGQTKRIQLNEFSSDMLTEDNSFVFDDKTSLEAFIAAEKEICIELANNCDFIIISCCGDGHNLWKPVKCHVENYMYSTLIKLKKEMDADLPFVLTSRTNTRMIQTYIKAINKPYVVVNSQGTKIPQYFNFPGFKNGAKAKEPFIRGDIQDRLVSRFISNGGNKI